MDSIVVEIVPKQASQHVYAVAHEEAEVVYADGPTEADKLSTSKKKRKLKLVVAAIVLVAVLIVGAILLYLKLADRDGNSSSTDVGPSMYMEVPCYTTEDQRNASNITEISRDIQIPQLSLQMDASDGRKLGYVLQNAVCNVMPSRHPAEVGLEDMQSLSFVLPWDFPTHQQAVFDIFRIASSSVSQKTERPGEGIPLLVSGLVLDFCDQLKDNSSTISARLDRAPTSEREQNATFILSLSAIYGAFYDGQLPGQTIIEMRLGGRRRKRAIRGFRVNDVEAYRQTFLFPEINDLLAGEWDSKRVLIDAAYLARRNGKSVPILDKEQAALQACSYIDLVKD